MSNTIGNFISNNVKDIRSSDKRLKIFEYLKNNILHNGFVFLQETHSRNSHQRCSVEIGLLKNFTKFTGKHLGQSLFFNKFASLRSATLLKKRLWHRCFPVNFVKFLRTPVLKNTSGRLLLTLIDTR